MSCSSEFVEFLIVYSPPSSHKDLSPASGCCRNSHVSPFESHASESNGNLQSTGRTQGLKRIEVGKMHMAPDTEYQTVRCSPDSNPRRKANRPHTGLVPSDTQVGISLRPVPSVRCLSLAELGTDYTGRTDSVSGALVASVRWVFLSEKHSHDFSNFPNSTIENMHFILSLPFKLHLLLKVCQHHNV